jgi:peptidoglycan/xylan/chitin deacetylase (PgdA/CDA1 family)
MRKIIPLLFLALLLFFAFFPKSPSYPRLTLAPPISSPQPTAQVATPTLKPLTFSELNAQYGPCVYLPTLTYHHIQTEAAAKADKQTSLTVYTDVFTKQMQYLADRGYTPVTSTQIINFFDHQIPLPPKPVFLTFDDGYVDFFTDAYPVLRQHHFSAIMFLPTGLVNNPDYLTWNQIEQMTSLVIFANHTWSHHSMSANLTTITKEISTADTQLTDHSLNSPKTFAYPYGAFSSPATTFLAQHGYSLAFTTRSGSTLCAKQRLILPRLHIGNTSLAAYGL